MNLAIYLGTVPPTLTGKPSRYVDGKPATKKPEVKAKHNAQREQGEQKRAAIMEMVEEWGEVDLNFLMADDCLDGICRRAVMTHMEKLVDAGKLVRIDPKHHRPGCPTIWRKP